MPQARPKSQAQADVGAAVLRAKMKLESFNKSMRLVNHVRASHKQIAVDTAHHFASLEAGGSGGGGGSGDDVAFGIGSGGYNNNNNNNNTFGGGGANADDDGDDVVSRQCLVSDAMLKQLRYEAEVLAEAAHVRRT